MESRPPHTVPSTVLYGLLAALFAWAGLYRVACTIDMTRLVLHPESTLGTLFLADWPDGPITFTAPDIDQRADPPIRKGDRLVSVDGEPYRNPPQLAAAFARAGVRGSIQAVVARRGDDGTEEEIASTVRLRSVAEGRKEVPSRLLVVVLVILMPAVCFLVGFWVAAVRVRDPMAWLVLLMLLGFSQVATARDLAYENWPTWVSLLGATYQVIFRLTWPIWFTLFGVHFAGRLAWERERPWLTPLVLGPFSVFAIAAVVCNVAAVLDARSLAPLSRLVDRIDLPATLTAMLAVCYFFVVMGTKSGMTEAPDGRRRVRLLMWGASIALTPLLIAEIIAVSTGRSVDELPVPFFVPAFLAVVIFPLTLAYVILVDRAMDVRVAVRQGLRYAATRGAIRVLVVLAMAAVVWNAWRLVSDPEGNRPQKLKGIAWGMLAAVVVPRLAQGALKWTDRRFFREAYDADHVLMGLAEEVRTIGETGPLLDTVLDRIGSTLHVDKLAVYLLDGTQFVPSRYRGFATPPAVVFPAGADALNRLRETSRPLRVRHDAPDSPLRRETISEETRAKLTELDAELLLPLNGRRELLGVVSLGPKKSEEPYSISDSKLLGAVADQTGLALENSRLMETVAAEVAKRERMHREIEIARDVQQKLFPQRLPAIAGLDCDGYCRPAQGVGGDYYDFLVLPGGRLGIALGDVAGKGIPAALLMASLQASLRGQRLSGPEDLSELMANLNRLIYEASPENRYATFFYGELDPATMRLDYVNAGHNAPMLFRAADGAVLRLAATGPVVGLLDGGRYARRSVTLDGGDILVVYSDGMSEAMNPEEEEWGEGRLQAAVRAAGPCTARELIERLLADADAFARGAVQHDDMTVVVVKSAA